MDEMRAQEDAPKEEVVIPENELPRSEQPRSDAWQAAASEGRREARYERIQERRVARQARRGYRSLFWPMVLIGAGVLWLLSNFGIVTSENWAVLVQLWPVLLIAAGLDLLFGRFSAILGSLIGLLTVAVIVGLVLVGPSMGWARDTTFFGMPIVFGDAEVKNRTFSEPLDNVETADVNLDFSFEPVTVSALPADSDELLHADIDYVGDLSYSASGSGSSRSISLQQSYAQVGWFSTGLNRNNMNWDISLSPDVLLDMRIEGSSGAATLDLGELMLSDLEVDASSGSMQLSLPAGDPYDFRLSGSSGALNTTFADGLDMNMTFDGSSGSSTFNVGQDSAFDLNAKLSSGMFTLNLGDGTSGTYELDGSSGSMRITVPRNAAVRVEIRSSGSGGVNLPSDLRQVEQGNDGEGVWQTDGYDSASSQINIVVDMGSGSLNVNH